MNISLLLLNVSLCLLECFYINLVYLWFIAIIHVIDARSHLRVGFWVLVYHFGLACRKTLFAKCLVPRLSWNGSILFKVVGYNGCLIFTVVYELRKCT